MNKEEYKVIEREYSIWLSNHPKRDYSYKAFSHLSRTIEFAKYYNEKKSEKLHDYLMHDALDTYNLMLSKLKGTSSEIELMHSKELVLEAIDEHFRNRQL